MSLAEVKNLRNQNRYEDAYRLSKSDLESKPEDIWMKRSHTWSIYYLIKKHVQAGESAQAKRFYAEFEALQMPPDETLIYERMAYFREVLSANYIAAKQLIQEGKFEEAFDLHAAAESPKSEQLAWSLYYLVRNQNKSKKPETAVLMHRLDFFKKNATPQKLLVFKLLLQELIKLPAELWSDTPLTQYLEFLGFFDLLDTEDYEKQDYEGKKIISLAERLHIAFSKALIREKASKARVEDYLRQIVEPLLEPHKGMLYVPYFKAKLLLEIGDRVEGLAAFMPFARKKQGEFWVWQVFAEYYHSDPELYLSCLCKAMTCRTKPEFLSGIKERLITHLIQAEDYDWAKSELIQLMKLREKQGWGSRTSHRAWINSPWYTAGLEIPLRGKYENYLTPAEKLLGGRSDSTSSEELLVVVDNLNPDKNMLNFLTRDKKKGFGKYQGIKPEVGGLYLIRGAGGGDGFYKIESLQKAEDRQEEMIHLRKQVSGTLLKKPGQSFGFVSGVFVSPGMIQAYELNENEALEGVAVYGPVKGKDTWAWRMVKMIKPEKKIALKLGTEY
ncbi:hypothetical protein SAMN03080617_01523 [Algoriphagus alkaliphilus]|uniref:Uncharacterized protein n=1 Tax=Algoriphagus alkaliphilus TaxID=279824 RepID=A0A1G5X288_9BACT|nr:hypothetical protein [Algoriphagus alkaliphilus]SDA64491.1 hypothetical protein SAMN03080617_01523 [Algoriphagus alkaliphilus]